MPLRHLGVKGEASILARQASTPAGTPLSATLMAPCPRTTTALRFLLPMTAPTPQPPATLKRSPMTQAAFTRFSPAGPMAAIYDAVVAQLSLEYLLGLVGGLAPDARSVAQLGCPSWIHRYEARQPCR